LENLDEILTAVAAGALSPSEAAGRLKGGEVRYLDDLAVLDLGRMERKGVPEVVYARGKTPEVAARICASVLEHRERVTISGASPEHEEALRATLPDIPVERSGRALVAPAPLTSRRSSRPSRWPARWALR
jgi:NCAIR mutase (PurE)-related protein